jgi:hypothetical protein
LRHHQVNGDAVAIARLRRPCEPSLHPSFRKEFPRMSHIVTVKTQMRDGVALAAACRRLGLAEPMRETVQLFSGQATGLAVRLPNWQYPVVVDVEAGEVHFDNFNGEWGEQSALDRLVQSYAVEKARLEARRKGFACSETTLQDGSIKLQILEGA